MRDILVIVLLLDSLAMIGLILLQHGKGADAGASFGGGAGGSESLFGSKGSSNFLSRTTAILAVIFFVVTLALAYAPLDRPSAKSVTEAEPIEKTVETPVSPPEQKSSKPAGKPQQPVVPQ
jgi:preprotein translocase subunit SecG